MVKKKVKNNDEDYGADSIKVLKGGNLSSTFQNSLFHKLHEWTL